MDVAMINKRESRNLLISYCLIPNNTLNNLFSRPF